ncbi:TPA: glycosyltransferase [Streptococcus agalactiae]
MIFVTVGTHEQQFNRLIKEVDRLKGTGAIDQEVFIQTGYSDFEPQNCQWSKFLSYDDMNSYMKEAEIVIIHGGPATFMNAVSKGKKTIVAPRQEQFGEHVNNHQVDFVNKVKTMYNFDIVVDIERLQNVVYEGTMNRPFLETNRSNFIEEFKVILKELCDENQ